MRLVFTLSILCAAVFYTFIAFTQLTFLSAGGRLGSGFFPRIIGLALIALCIYNIYQDRKGQQEEEGFSPYWRTTVLVVVLSGLFVLTLNVLGGLSAMILYMMVTLALLNRGRWLQNVLIGILLPGVLYLMFHSWLNAAMPEGIVPFLR